MLLTHSTSSKLTPLSMTENPSYLKVAFIWSQERFWQANQSAGLHTHENWTKQTRQKSQRTMFNSDIPTCRTVVLLSLNDIPLFLLFHMWKFFFITSFTALKSEWSAFLYVFFFLTWSKNKNANYKPCNLYCANCASGEIF